YLKMGDREKASIIALQLTKAKTQLVENQAQLNQHEEAYTNNLKKIQFANKKLGELQDKIDTKRGKARVATDMSREGLDKIEQDEQLEKAMAEDALKDLEVDLGMRAPETTPVQQAT